jgi:class 3 adenylate cyclase
MKIDTEELTLSEIVQLQNRLSETLKRRFEKPRALVFTDVVDSTGYAARWGNEALRALNQRHLELLDLAVYAEEGSVVDVAGDGAFTCFRSAEQAVRAMVALQRSVQEQNLSHQPEHALLLRIGVHFGHVLTDEEVVTGREVHVCARVAASAAPGEIRATLAALHELPSALRVGTTSLPPEQLKGFTDSFSLVRIPWQAPVRPRPMAVCLRETGQRFVLPDRPTLSFGRMRSRSGETANDIVLELPDGEQTARISRWHFELRRRDARWFLRSLTENLTEVDGRALAKGDERLIEVGSIVRLAGVVTLEFERAPQGAVASELQDTIVAPGVSRR